MTEVMEAENKQEALYNRYRPRKFSEIVGQDFTKAALRRAISTGDLKHAYLLSGDRGCGKTTTARIIAAAVNCEYAEGGEPCGDCDICEATFAGTFTGVVTEMNAADNRSINDIRGLISIIDLGVAYNRKVIIIDECHRLTQDAWSALLKPIEEPPNSQTLWILATTDPQKIPHTILSRVAKLNFTLLDSAQLTGLAKSITSHEGLDFTDEQIESMVWTGQGSARDTITALERVAMGLELATPTSITGVVNGLLHRDMSEILVSLVSQDHEVNYPSIAEEVLGFYERAIIAQHTPDLIDPTYRFAEQVHELAAEAHQAELVRAIVVMSDALGNLNSLGSTRSTLIGSLARVLEPTGSKRMGRLQDEMKTLSEKMDSIVHQIGLVGLDISAQQTIESDSWPLEEPKRVKPSRRKQPSRDDTPDEEVRTQRGPEDDRHEPDQDTPAPAKKKTRKAQSTEDSVDAEWEDLVESLSRRSKRIAQQARVSVEGSDLIVSSDARVPENVRRRIRDSFPDFNCVFENRRD